ncbi:MAG: ATP-binding cassette domain-containing protein [Micromonosporaceae bacterium]|nr:ATP-binding cassette domain-containing protein [Micromonosporaceae bacterium]
MSDGEIVVSHLAKQYRAVRAVDDLSFAVEPGRVTGFLGPNGAGKTTTLRMLLNLVTPSAGTATIGGQRYADLTDPLRRVGAVLEASSAHRARTGRNHLRAIGAAAGFPARRADQVLELVGLTPAARRKFKGYSMGMRQRLGIAAAMLGDPGVLILDEPANGLDPEGIRWMRDLLKRLADEGRTVLVSSHLLSEMQLLADDVLIIAKGKLVTHGSVSDVVDGRAHAGPVRVRTPQAEQLTAALGSAATVTTGEDGALLVSGVDAPAVGAAALRAGVELHELVAEKPDLERVFLDLTAGKADIR